MALILVINNKHNWDDNASAQNRMRRKKPRSSPSCRFARPRPTVLHRHLRERSKKEHWKEKRSHQGIRKTNTKYEWTPRFQNLYYQEKQSNEATNMKYQINIGPLDINSFGLSFHSINDMRNGYHLPVFLLDI